jgi:tRNA (cytidine/uridine-2'-O-)-methyltransferase
MTQFDHQQRLRARSNARFHVVLVHPEIPPNTGNIARLCAATGCHLHLVHPLGFEVSEKAVRRAGLDYWHLVTIIEHASWSHFQNELEHSARCFFFTGKCNRSFLQVKYQPGDFLIFGKESTGLPSEILEEYREHLVGIPTLGAVRSLNLANSATLGVYEALRQSGALDVVELTSLDSGDIT